MSILIIGIIAAVFIGVSLAVSLNTKTDTAIPLPTNFPTQIPTLTLIPSAGPTMTATNSPPLIPTKIALTSSPAPANNIPPNSGYSRQQVKIDTSVFTIDIIAADLNSTKVIVDTASEGDCRNDCPALPLAEYVSRNGAYAAINGSYFCPTDYQSCAGKTNSFDTLLMSKNKTYFNSDNNIYSSIPAVIFSPSSIRFVSRSLEWGRDTGVDGVIANYPLLLSGGNIVFSGDGDTKLTNKGNRSFVGSKASTVYIGVIRSATVLESAKVLHSLGLSEALNLDDGGSTALWYNGYKAGPGRNIPNAILFITR